MRVIAGAIRRDDQLRQLGASVHNNSHRAKDDFASAEDHLLEVKTEVEKFESGVGADFFATPMRPWIGYLFIGSLFVGEIYFQGLALDALGIGGLGRWAISAGISVALIWMAHFAAQVLRKRLPALLEKIAAGVCIAVPVVLITVLAFWRQNFIDANRESDSKGFLANLLIATTFFLCALIYSYFAAEPIALQRRNLTGKLCAAQRHCLKVKNQLDESATIFQQIDVLRTGNFYRAAQLVDEWGKLHEKAGAPYRGRYALTARKMGAPVPVVISSRGFDIESPAWLSEPIDWDYLGCAEHVHPDGALAIPNASVDAAASISNRLEVVPE